MTKTYQDRPYQTDAIERLRASIKKGNRRIILTLATGAGKSVISRRIVEMAKAKGNNVLFVAHRTLLITQMKETLKEFDNVTVGTIQALSKKKHDVKIVIVDECHNANGTKLQNNLPDEITIGLSATPITASGHKLKGWDDIIDVVQLSDLINMGFACPVKVKAPLLPDRSKIKIKAGEYDTMGAYELMSEPIMVRDIVDVYTKHAKGLRTLVYCVNIEHAEIMANNFKDAGYRADCVHSKKADSIEAFNNFKRGNIDILCNVGVLTTGIDLPDVYCIILATPIKSIIKAVQIYGRATRLNPNDGDKVALILDCAGVVQDTVHPLQRLEFDREPIKKNKKICKACGGELLVLNRIVTPPNPQGDYTVITNYKCRDCKAVTTIEDMKLLPETKCEQCGYAGKRKITFTQSEKEAVFEFECPSCGLKSDFRAVKLTDEQLKEVEYEFNKNSWGYVKKELRKGTNKEGKKYHYLWANIMLDLAQELELTPLDMVEIIEDFNKKGRRLGGIGAVMRERAGDRVRF
jgi:superfamily II DNA or RNA helicase